jgi:hypothetical protein
VVVSGTAYPLKAYGRVEGDWDNVIGLPDAVDNSLDFPEATSLMFVPQTPKTRIFTVRLVVVNATAALTNDSLAQLQGLLWTPSAPILFRRIIPRSAGDETSEAYATYLTGFNPSRPAPNVALLAPQFRMLSPYWYNSTPVAVSL